MLDVDEQIHQKTVKELIMYPNREFSLHLCLPHKSIRAQQGTLILHLIDGIIEFRTDSNGVIDLKNDFHVIYSSFNNSIKEKFPELYDNFVRNTIDFSRIKNVIFRFDEEPEVPIEIEHTHYNILIESDKKKYFMYVN